MLARYDCSKRRSGRGGIVDRRGLGPMLSTMSEWIWSDEVVMVDLTLEVGDWMVAVAVAVAGALAEVAVEGFTS